jgi:hypothetical protein
MSHASVSDFNVIPMRRRTPHFPPDYVDDDPTIELELTPEQMEMLSRAAEPGSGESESRAREPERRAAPYESWGTRPVPARPAAPVQSFVEQAPPLIPVGARPISIVPVVPAAPVARQPEPPRPASAPIHIPTAARAPAPARPVDDGPVPMPTTQASAVETPPPATTVLPAPTASPTVTAPAVTVTTFVAARASTPDPAVTSVRPASGAGGKARFSRAAIGVGIVAVCAVSAGIAWFARPTAATPSAPPVERVPEPVPAPPAVEPAATPAAPHSTEIKPVRFANPFDRGEVFEFPPGTSEAEARDAVADLLLKRARERLNPTSDASELPRPANSRAAGPRSRVARRD